MKVFLIVAALLLAILFLIANENVRTAEIKQKVEGIGATLVMCEPRMYDTPFLIMDFKTEDVYRFVYQLNNKQLIGWVKFSILNTEWKWDYKR